MSVRFVMPASDSNATQTLFWVGRGFGQPVPVTFEYTDDGCVLTNPDTGISGFGESLVDAITDIETALREHYDVLTEHHVVTSLRAQRRYLSRHIFGDAPDGEPGPQSDLDAPIIAPQVPLPDSMRSNHDSVDWSEGEL